MICWGFFLQLKMCKLFFYMERNTIILALSISWFPCATYLVLTSDFFQTSRKGKTQKHMAKARLSNKSTLVSDSKDTLSRSLLATATLLLMGDWNRWIMALACLSGFRSFGRDFHNLLKLVLSIARLV